MKYFYEDRGYYPIRCHNALVHNDDVFSILIDDDTDEFLLCEGVGDKYAKYTSWKLKELLQEAIEWIEKMEKEGVPDE